MLEVFMYLTIYLLKHFSQIILLASQTRYSYVLFCSYMSIVESLPTYGVHYYAVKVRATKKSHLLN